MLKQLAPGHDRAKYLGGSDIAAAVGFSPWRTPLDLWRDKIKPRKEGPQKKVFTRGVRWEAVVAEMLVESLKQQGHTVEIVNTNCRYIDSEFDFMAAEIDFEIRLDGEDEITNVELKTVHPFKLREWGESGTDTVPTHYVAQVLHGMGVTRRRKAMLAALFGADELRVYPIPHDEETIEWLRSEGAKFWQDHVLTKIAPEPSNMADLDKMHPTEDGESPALTADENLTEMLMRMRECSAEIKAREAEMESLEFRVRRAMANKAEIVLPNGSKACEWKVREGTYLDQESLKKDHLGLARKYTRKWTKRIFTLKNFKAEGI